MEKNTILVVLQHEEGRPPLMSADFMVSELRENWYNAGMGKKHQHKEPIKLL